MVKIECGGAFELLFSRFCSCFRFRGHGRADFEKPQAIDHRPKAVRAKIIDSLLRDLIGLMQNRRASRDVTFLLPITVCVSRYSLAGRGLMLRTAKTSL